MPLETLTIRTNGQGLYEFTQDTLRFVRAHAAADAVLTIFVRHTSCSLLIQENADPDVQRDLNAFFARLVPPSDDASMNYIVHTAEGPDDMPAHIKAAMMPTSLSIPVEKGRLLLGTWQGLYLFEHRTQPHSRQIVIHLTA
ncbi:secondary thiamine-phosphate synthase enzyme YjbQ [Oceaniradius stylonematis]|uniref:secondary thiamine-phosphate synthase enzyme YjbQ n=1 Tax=Oceaniradius stylonematis TaxID=2184161 RepID=UPI000F3AFA1D|nr:MAG: YjbQ family protein [Oricola sp.]